MRSAENDIATVRATAILLVGAGATWWIDIGVSLMLLLSLFGTLNFMTVEVPAFCAAYVLLGTILVLSGVGIARREARVWHVAVLASVTVVILAVLPVALAAANPYLFTQPSPFAGAFVVFIVPPLGFAAVGLTLAALLATLFFLRPFTGTNRLRTGQPL